jgi:hypothetical protein
VTAVVENKLFSENGFRINDDIELHYASNCVVPIEEQTCFKFNRNTLKRGNLKIKIKLTT